MLLLLSPPPFFFVLFRSLELINNRVVNDTFKARVRASSVDLLVICW